MQVQQRPPVTRPTLYLFRDGVIVFVRMTDSILFVLKACSLRIQASLTMRQHFLLCQTTPHSTKQLYLTNYPTVLKYHEPRIVRERRSSSSFQRRKWIGWRRHTASCRRSRRRSSTVVGEYQATSHDPLQGRQALERKEIATVGKEQTVGQRMSPTKARSDREFRAPNQCVGRREFATSVAASGESNRVT